LSPLLAEALPLLRDIAGAHAVLVLRETPTGSRVAARAGASVEPCALDPATISSHLLQGDAGVLVLVSGPAPIAEPARRAAVALAEAVVARAAAERRLADLVDRVRSAQELANMGDYEWHIATDTNRWSDQLYRIYGHEPQSFDVTYESFLAQIHPDDRGRVQAVHQRAYATCEPYQMVERIIRPDGEVRFLSSTGRVLAGPDGAPERITGTCIDITERVRAEQAREDVAAALREAELRRRQALEINDNVIQGLTAAVLALGNGDTFGCTHFLERTLGSARHLMNDWLQPLDGGDVRPGDLVRAVPSTLGLRPAVPVLPPPPAPPAPAPGACRILIAEDNSDVRFLLRAQLEVVGSCDVVGEAEDGAEAVRLAEALQPDVVLLDLSMPRMDGLQALPLIRDKAPGTRVIVMSGFAEKQMKETALAAGAVRYVEKGLRMDLAGLIEGVLKSA
jgi:PAS domain S-box-containing protein